MPPLLICSKIRDATKTIVDRAIQEKSRIGLSPGGIAEMFVPTTHPNEEYALLAQRKGFIRMSIKHNVPIVPIYVFGATKMFHRLSLPSIFERLSKWFKLSLCIFYGRLGLPIPFRQKLLYVIGHPLFPPSLTHLSHSDDGGANTKNPSSSDSFQNKVNEFHQIFCEKIVELFNCYKKYYGWEHKNMCII
jgi:2-acylglycerol O-acyltransferase 2